MSGDPGLVTAIAKDEALNAAYNEAIQDGDAKRADQLTFTVTGVLKSYFEAEHSRIIAAEMIALLLSNRDKPATHAWCKGILDSMAKAGMINPSA